LTEDVAATVAAAGSSSSSKKDEKDESAADRLREERDLMRELEVMRVQTLFSFLYLQCRVIGFCFLFLTDFFSSCFPFLADFLTG
jgi:hypothetical protein